MDELAATVQMKPSLEDVEKLIVEKVLCSFALLSKASAEKTDAAASWNLSAPKKEERGVEDKGNYVGSVWVTGVQKHHALKGTAGKGRGAVRCRSGGSTPIRVAQGK